MWERFSAPVQADPGAHPASYTMDTGSFPGIRWPGRGADHPPPSKRRGRERVGLHLYSPFGPSWLALVRNSRRRTGEFDSTAEHTLPLLSSSP